MRWSNLIFEVEHGLEETQNQRDARVEKLWHKLEPTQHGTLDLKGLKKGFKKIDHPMKNADDLLEKIIKEVDTNRDGQIQYEEFRDFVEQAELQLYVLFKAIDKDGNGRLDKRELRTAFKTAGLTVSNRRLDEFFNDMDDNHDGYISYDEWRNFLLFMPAGNYESKLRAVLSYYDGIVSVTAEGDSLVSDESLEGLGTKDSSSSFLSSLFENLFGSLIRMASPNTTHGRGSPEHPPITASKEDDGGGAQVTTSRIQKAVQLDLSRDFLDHIEDSDVASHDYIKTAVAKQRQAFKEVLASRDGKRTPAQAGDGTSTRTISSIDREDQPGGAEKRQKKFTLTKFIPDPGYFLAGAIAGGVSRTTTAPLDRLKVYLLVNTKADAETAVAALKRGKPVAAVKNAARPFADAVKDLYRSGGLRGFFAGNGLNVVKIMPETAIKFGSYEAAKRALATFEGHGDPQKINSYSKFTAGGVAGMIAQFCVYPLDTLKFRLQCETVEGGVQGAALVRQTAVRMYADGGLRACYRGVTMGLIGMFPYSAIDMGMFELLKTSYRSYYAKAHGLHEDDVEAGNIATGIIGATSGAFGASVVYPLNVVRTRLQTQGTAMHSATYTGIWDVTQKTIQHEGFRGLYKGLTPNLLKVAPALSITWIVYENSKKLLGLH